MSAADCCCYCGASGPGQYAERISVPLIPEAGEPAYTHEMVFYCAGCVREMEEAEALDQEMMKDPEYAEISRELDEMHAQRFREALARNGIKLN